MRLQEYFNQQQDMHLSEAEKLDMYRLIIDKQHKRSFLNKRSILHVKTFTYTSFIVLLLFGFYGIYFFQQSKSLDGDGIYLMSSSQGQSVVQADYIAKVVDFAGSFYIEKDGKTIQTSNINDGDIVVLQNNAQIIFHIDTGTQAKIIGPAKFTIQKKSGNAFRINLMYGDYVEMKSLNKTNVQGVELSVDDIVVAQGSKGSPVDFQILKQGEQRVIKNNGANLIVMNQDAKNKTNVNKEQILAIRGNDVSLFDNFDKFAKAINNKDLSQTFSLALNTISKDPEAILSKTTEKLDPEMLAKSNIAPLADADILSIADSSDDDKNVPSISAVISSNQKGVPSLDQKSVLENKFTPKFVIANLEDISLAYLGGLDSFSREISSLDSRIKEVSKSFNIVYSSPSGSENEKIKGLITKLADLKNEIETKYYFPPKYLTNLEKTETWLKYLSTQTFGQLKDKGDEEILKTTSFLKF